MKRRFDRTTIPKILTFLTIAILAVMLMNIFIMGLKRVTITGTVFRIDRIEDEDSITYRARASGEYQGQTRTFTKNVSRRTAVGNTIKGKIFPDTADQDRYNRIIEMTVLPIIGAFCFGIWWIGAWSTLAAKRRKRLDDVRASAAAASTSSREAFDKPEAVPPHVADAWEVIGQRGLSTHDIAAGLTEEEWDTPEMKANILRPDVSKIEDLMARETRPMLTSFFEGIYKKRRVKEFREKIPVPIRERCHYEWQKYKIGPDADTCSVRVTWTGGFENSAYEFQCSYELDGTLPSDLSAPVLIKFVRVVSEFYAIPDNGD